MPKLTGNKVYTSGQITTIQQALSFLNEDGSAASSLQVSRWIDNEVKVQVRCHAERLESAKAGAIVRGVIKEF